MLLTEPLLAALNVAGGIGSVIVGVSVLVGDDEMDHYMKKMRLRKDPDRVASPRPPRRTRPHRRW